MGLRLTIFGKVYAQPIPPIMYLNTTSVLSSWTPDTVTNDGVVLTWQLTGGKTETKVVDKPTFNLSSNTGTVNMAVSDVSQLKFFTCNTKNISLLNLKGASALLNLQILFNQITDLDLSKNNQLAFINVSNNNISSLVFQNHPALSTLISSTNSLTNLDISGAPNLKQITCHTNNLTTLNTSNNPNLEAIACFLNYSLSSINLSNNIKLIDLNIGRTGISTLDVSMLPYLIFLNIDRTSITSINLLSNPNLSTLHTYNNGMQSLDLSGNPVLKTLWFYQNSSTPANTDSAIIQLESKGQSGGVLRIRNNRTSASDTAWNNLTSRGYTLQLYST